MDRIKECAKEEQTDNLDDDEAIDSALLQMEILYKCRCVQPPFGSNVTIREINRDEYDSATLPHKEQGWDQKE